MNNVQVSSKKFDLQERTQLFAKDVRRFLKTIPNNFHSFEDIKQLLRSSGSVAANYIEAREGFSERDFYYRIKLCRKESKESAFWLRMLVLDEPTQIQQQTCLGNEARELELIFGAIVRKRPLSL